MMLLAARLVLIAESRIAFMTTLRELTNVRYGGQSGSRIPDLGSRITAP
jgi:hypothetical protein